jgi:hypothetical protein
MVHIDDSQSNSSTPVVEASTSSASQKSTEETSQNSQKSTGRKSRKSQDVTYLTIGFYDIQTTSTATGILKILYLQGAHRNLQNTKCS